MTMTRPDVDLTDGTFYSSQEAREAYRWMRANQPVFRDRNGLAGATTYQAILDGRQPRDLTADKLLAHSRLPLTWHEQRRVLGFA